MSDGIGSLGRPRAATPSLNATTREHSRPRLWRYFRWWALTVPFWLSPGIVYGDEAINWVAYYASQAPGEAIKDFEVIVLDSDYPESIAELREEGKILLAYLSVGEISSQRGYFEEVRREKYLLDESKNWPGSFKVDVRDPSWTERIVQDLIPRFLRAGFSGVFLDTLDTTVELEKSRPSTYRGMRLAASRLVQTIRQNYPQIKIMVNRGYELIPDFGSQIDFVLGESVYTSYAFDEKRYIDVPAETVEQHVSMLRYIQGRYKNLRVMTLDYWDPEDTAKISHIYSVQRHNGFSPYVASIGLDRIIPQPYER